MLDKCEKDVTEKIRHERIRYWEEYNCSPLAKAHTLKFLQQASTEILAERNSYVLMALTEFNESRERDGY